MKRIIKKFNDGEALIKIVEPDILQFISKRFWLAVGIIYTGLIGYTLYKYDFSPAVYYAIIAAGAILLLIYIRIMIRRLFTYLMITTDRLIYIKRRGLFKKEIIEMQYTQLKMVSSHFKGFISSVVRVGEVIIDRGGYKDNIVLKSVRHPQTVQDLVMKLQREYTYMRKFEDMDGTQYLRHRGVESDDYISARELMLFMRKVVSLEDVRQGAVAAIGKYTGDDDDDDDDDDD